MNMLTLSPQQPIKHWQCPRGGLILLKAAAKSYTKLNSAVFPAGQGGPLMHVIAAKAVCFKEAMELNLKLISNR